LLLRVAGGAFGFALSLWALHLLLKAIPISFRSGWTSASISACSLHVSAFTLLRVMLFGAVPRLQTSRVDLNDHLKKAVADRLAFVGIHVACWS
jgi:hypothetical protein